MNRIIMLAIVTLVGLLGVRAFAQSPTASPKVTATEPPSRVYVANQQSSFFPASDQETGVWQGCGPAQDQGLLEDFNKDHARVRIVQVFIDASIPCKAPGSHAFVIVYQAESHLTRRSVRYPMAR
jgi:hypothetical protein